MSTEPFDTALPPLRGLPTKEEWEALSAAQQDALEDSLPRDFPFEYNLMTEGDAHASARHDCQDTLRRYYRSQGRALYVGADLMVFYPAEAPVRPDVFVVLDTEDRDRTVWNVLREKRGLDWAFEVLASGERAKDLKRNVQRYASLGIAEYFVYDLRTRRLRGWRQAAPEVRRYEPLVAENGALPSQVLGLELFVAGRRVRFKHATAELLSTSDQLERLEDAVNDMTMVLEESTERAEAETRRANTEAQRANTEAQRANTEAQRANTEAQRANTEAQRAERERAEKEAALAKIEELERALAAAKRS